MRKTVSIFLSLVLLVQGLSLNAAELEKLDDLLAHAQFHKERYGDDFAEFIDKHYGNQKAEHNREHQEEERDHQNLPLNHSNPLVLQPVFMPDPLMTDIRAALFPELEKEHFFYGQFYTSLIVTEILQPPQFI